MTFQIHSSIPSQFITPRQVEIWFPPGYEADVGRGFPVLYMHDGQNVFSAATSTHKIPWGVDEGLLRLIAKNQVRAPIVVGIWNHPTRRWAEFMPQKAFDYPGGEEKRARFVQEAGQPFSDMYLRFIVEELKPFMDRTYRTLPDQGDTFIMGSSMGGLISLYALCEYPQVFGGAACLSTHWVSGEGVVLDYLRANLPQPGRHKLYFDFGTVGLDADYEPYQMQADEIMRFAGYQPDVDWMTRKFPGAEHNEAAWQARVHIPLEFLFSRKL